jgi:hypothetical protein
MGRALAGSAFTSLANCFFVSLVARHRVEEAYRCLWNLFEGIPDRDDPEQVGAAMTCTGAG